jgi:membrane protein implicated in regulation of membrane protease activity
MEAIYWTSIGLLLLVTELFVPSGMYLLIIGLAVLLTGFLSWIGVFTSLGYESLNSQIVVASALSIVMMFTIRKWISNLFNTY